MNDDYLKIKNVINIKKNIKNEKIRAEVQSIGKVNNSNK